MDGQESTVIPVDRANKSRRGARGTTRQRDAGTTALGWRREWLVTLGVLVALTAVGAPPAAYVGAGAGALPVDRSTGSVRSDGDGGLATQAMLVDLNGLTVDAHDTLYIAAGNSVRAVDLATDRISTVADLGREVHDIAADEHGRLYVSEWVESNGKEILPDSLRAIDPRTQHISTIVTANSDGAPAFGGIVVGGGMLYYSDPVRPMVSAVDLATGHISTIAGTGKDGYSGDGGPATAATLSSTFKLCIDARGMLYVADGPNNAVRRIDLDRGVIATVAGTGESGYSGDGGPATRATLSDPFAVAVGPDGVLYIADTGNSVVRAVDPKTRRITTVVRPGLDKGTGIGPAWDAQSFVLGSIATDSRGILYIADTGNNVVLAYNPRTGRLTTIAGNDGSSDEPTVTPTATATPAPVAPRVRAAGYTFAGSLLADRWAPAFRAAHPRVPVRFAPSSSAAALAALAAGRADLALRSGPLSARQLAAESAACPVGVLHLPVAVNAVGVVYHLPGLRPAVRLTPAALAALFLGRIARWDDPRLRALNPGVALPALPVRVVYRRDGARATALLRAYLTTESPAWRAGPGDGPAVRWPVGMGAMGAPREAAALRGAPGTLGYLDLPDARAAGLPTAAIRDRAGAYVRASIAGAEVAAQDVGGTALGGREPVVLDDTATGAYPLAHLILADLCRSRGLRDRQGQVVAQFARYMLTDGQAELPDAGYAPLPPSLRDTVLAKLRGVTPALTTATTATAATATTATTTATTVPATPTPTMLSMSPTITSVAPAPTMTATPTATS